MTNATYDATVLVTALKAINEKAFTVANLARAMKINEKIARRRMRANAARAKGEQMKIAKRVDATSRANVKYEYALTEANVTLIADIIK